MVRPPNGSNARCYQPQCRVTIAPLTPVGNLVNRHAVLRFHPEHSPTHLQGADNLRLQALRGAGGAYHLDSRLIHHTLVNAVEKSFAEPW